MYCFPPAPGTATVRSTPPIPFFRGVLCFHAFTWWVWTQVYGNKRVKVKVLRFIQIGRFFGEFRTLRPTFQDCSFTGFESISKTCFNCAPRGGNYMQTSAGFFWENHRRIRTARAIVAYCRIQGPEGPCSLRPFHPTVGRRKPVDDRLAGELWARSTRKQSAGEGWLLRRGLVGGFG